jgi:hypothetical protein
MLHVQSPISLLSSSVSDLLGDSFCYVIIICPGLGPRFVLPRLRILSPGIRANAHAHVLRERPAQMDTGMFCRLSELGRSRDATDTRLTRSHTNSHTHKLTHKLAIDLARMNQSCPTIDSRLPSSIVHCPLSIVHRFSWICAALCMTRDLLPVHMFTHRIPLFICLRN